MKKSSDVPAPEKKNNGNKINRALKEYIKGNMTLEEFLKHEIFHPKKS